MSDVTADTLKRFGVEEGKVPASPDTQHYVMNQTMLRIRDPEQSLKFYTETLGMTLLKRLDFPEMAFSLYFVGYARPCGEAIPEDARERTVYTFRQAALLELTHNWGTESDEDFNRYHDGNQEPQGFGHIGQFPHMQMAIDGLDRFRAGTREARGLVGREAERTEIADCGVLQHMGRNPCGRHFLSRASTGLDNSVAIR